MSNDVALVDWISSLFVNVFHVDVMMMTLMDASVAMMNQNYHLMMMLKFFLLFSFLFRVISPPNDLHIA